MCFSSVFFQRHTAKWLFGRVHKHLWQTEPVTLDQRIFLLMIPPMEERTKFLWTNETFCICDQVLVSFRALWSDGHSALLLPAQVTGGRDPSGETSRRGGPLLTSWQSPGKVTSEWSNSGKSQPRLIRGWFWRDTRGGRTTDKTCKCLSKHTARPGLLSSVYNNQRAFHHLNYPLPFIDGSGDYVCSPFTSTIP